MPTNPDLAALSAAATEPFRREWRYIVVKRKHITAEQEIALMEIINSFNLPELECAVVESDWPEYEPVWRMIENRVNAYRAGRLVLIDREGLRDRVSEQLRAAYNEGATNVHDAWIADLGQREADFGEAAHDYAGDTADAAVAAILGDVKP